MADEQAGTDEQAQEQARQDEQRQRARNAKKRWLARLKWLWLLPVLAAVGFFIWRSRQPAEVEVIHPQKRMVAQTLTASGRVAGVREVNLSADRTGILVNLLVDEGASVMAGEVVARISSEVETAELQQAEAAVATARASLAEARANAETLPPTIRQAEAESQGSIEQARERLAAAEARLQELLAGGRDEQIREAEAAVEQAQARLDQAEVDVKRARSLATSDATARAALERAEASARDAQARVQEARTRLAQARRDLKRSRRLFDEGVMAEAEYEAAQTAEETAAEAVNQAQARLEQAEVEVENQRRLLEVTREEQLDRALTEREAARQQLEQARAGLDLVTSPARKERITQQRAEVRNAQAALQQAIEAGPARVESLRRTPAQERIRVAERRLEEALATREAVAARLEKTAVTARFGGVITDTVLEPGDVVTPGQPIVTMSEMQFPEVHVEIDERNIAEVEAGQEAFLTADAHPEKTIEARVKRIAPEAITERGIVDVILQMRERPEWLRTGMTMDANIVVEDKQEMLVLPTRAVVQSGQQYSVLVVDAGVVRELSVETGVGGVRGTVIRSGLREDAMVIREPTAVSEGQQVEPVEADLELGGENGV